MPYLINSIGVCLHQIIIQPSQTNVLFTEYICYTN